MLHKFDLNSEHTSFYPAGHFWPFSINCTLRHAPHFDRAPQNIKKLCITLYLSFNWGLTGKNRDEISL